MKIALCKSQFFGPVSGADEILVSYAISLYQSGKDIEVVLLYKPTDNDRYFRRLRHAGVPVNYVIKRSIAFMILKGLRGMVSSFLLFFLFIPRSEAGLRKVWQLLIDLISRIHYDSCRTYFSQTKYDLLHVFTPDTGALLMIRAGKEAGIPVLYHEMGTPHHLPALEPYYRRLEKVLPLCSAVAALSPILAKQWLDRFPFLSKVLVLPLVTEDSGMLNVSVGLPRVNNETIFGYAARIEEGKGPLVLAEALARLRETRQGVLVRVAGTGPALPEVKVRARELQLDGSWELVGTYEGKVGCSAFMRTLDVFVLPSFAEGTSKSVIEAMAHGLPIITTNVGGLPDLVTPDAGIIVPPGDSIALADAMERLASDPAQRNRMGQIARERYLKLFSPEAVLSMLLSTYSSVIGYDNHVMSGAFVERHPWAIENNGQLKAMACQQRS